MPSRLREALETQGWALLHGDCMDQLPILRFAGEYFDAVITDPPYGVDFQSNMRTATEKMPKIANDLQPFIWFLWDSFRLTKEGGHLICFHDWHCQEAFRQAIEWAGYTIKGQLVWDKDVHGMGDLNGQFAPQHELMWHAVKGRGELYSQRRPTTLMRIPRVAPGAITHQNEKPVALLRHLVRSVCPPGGIVLDPFAGSGSTMKAARLEGRRSVGIEISRECCVRIDRNMSVEQTTMQLEEVS